MPDGVGGRVAQENARELVAGAPAFPERHLLVEEGAEFAHGRQGGAEGGTGSGVTHARISPAGRLSVASQEAILTRTLPIMEGSLRARRREAPIDDRYRTNAFCTVRDFERHLGVAPS